MKILDTYVLHDYIGLCKDYKFEIYDHLSDDYQEYENALNKKDTSDSSD